MKFEIYNRPIELTVSGRFDRWYWRARAKNGKIIADGAERYASKRNARRAVSRFIDLMFEAGHPADIVILD
jgi:uncharacterized protein YegP (UPF0339 family)